MIKEDFKHAKTIGAVNEGVDVLASSQIKGVAIAASNDSRVTSETAVVMTRNASDLMEFCNEFMTAISQHQQLAA